MIHYPQFYDMILGMCQKGQIKEAALELLTAHSSMMLRFCLDVIGYATPRFQWAGELEKEVRQHLQTNQNGKKRYGHLLGNPLMLLSRISADEEAVKWHYYNDSRCWKAIQKHIEKTRPCVLIDLEPNRLHFTHHGPCSLKHSYGHPGVTMHFDSYDVGRFSMDFTVSYLYDEDDDYHGEREGFGKEYHLAVPLELEDDCTDREFDERFVKWLKVMAVEQKKRLALKDVSELERLIKKNPDDARRLVAKLKS